MDAWDAVGPAGREFVGRTPWRDASCQPLAGDASARTYYRLRQDDRSAVLMAAAQNRECVRPFYEVGAHLQQLGLSAPSVYAWDPEQGFMLLEDFGDDTFARLLAGQADETFLYTLATDVLIALHQRPDAIPDGLRAYHPEKMLEDLELYLEWCGPGMGEEGRREFRRCWGAVLPVAHQVPESLLLRDYHVANLMLLAGRPGIRQAGLLDFQDAYRGPVTYDLVSLLQDARRDVPPALQERLLARYQAAFPALDARAFAASAAILAALRHTRVLAIFRRLSLRDRKPEYQHLHAPRVERLLHNALTHPALAGLKQWFLKYES